MSFLRIIRLVIPIIFSLLFSACWGKQSSVPKGNGSGFTGIIKAQEKASGSVRISVKQTDTRKPMSTSAESKHSRGFEYAAPEMGKKATSLEPTNLVWGKTEKATIQKFQNLRNVEIPSESIEKSAAIKKEVIEKEEIHFPPVVATAESQLEQSLERQLAFFQPIVMPHSVAQEQSADLSVPLVPSEEVIFWMQKNDENVLEEKMGSLKLPEETYQNPVLDVWDIYQQSKLAALVTDDFTISATFRSVSAYKPNFFFHGPSFQLVYMSGRLEFRYLDPGSNPSQRSLSVPLAIKMGSAHRIQIVRTHSALRFYLDGQLVNETKIEGDFSVISDLNKFYLFSPVVKQRAQIEFDEVKITLP